MDGENNGKLYMLRNLGWLSPMTDPWDERYIYRSMNGFSFLWDQCR